MTSEAFLEHGTSKPYSAMDTCGQHEFIITCYYLVITYYYTVITRNNESIITYYYTVITRNNEFIITYYYIVITRNNEFIITLTHRVPEGAQGHVRKGWFLDRFDRNVVLVELSGYFMLANYCSA